VQDCISLLHAAGLNVWMITGDKAETAVAIGKKCALIQPGKHEIERVVNLSGEVLRQRILDLFVYVHSRDNGPEANFNPIRKTCLYHNLYSLSDSYYLLLYNNSICIYFLGEGARE
jgi:magnesium-transporting ATPase (P-type)